MKKVICISLSFLLSVSLAGCGNNNAETSSVSDNAVETIAPTPDMSTEPVNEDELIDDPAWDQLESLGKVEAENGIFFVTLTLPADFVGEDITQESIDANAGVDYISGKLNEDGSVTYRMTKRQHKAMLDMITESFDEALQGLVDDEQYTFTDIKHNNSYSEFDVYLSTDQIGLAEGFAALGFYLYAGVYSTFSGHTPDHILVNYYGPSGLIKTMDSADLNSN